VGLNTDNQDKGLPSAEEGQEGAKALQLLAGSSAVRRGAGETPRLSGGRLADQRWQKGKGLGHQEWGGGLSAKEKQGKLGESLRTPVAPVLLVARSAAGVKPGDDAPPRPYP